MGFQQNVVVSSAVSADGRRGILSAAFARWPFARGPFNPESYPERVVFGLPELTSYQFSGGADHARAVHQNHDVADGLPEWSRAFPAVTFAYIEADCFGGSCRYTGYCCCDSNTVGGNLVEGAKTRTYDGLRGLLSNVGIEMETGYFEPFVRGYFSELREDQWLSGVWPTQMFRAISQLGRKASERKFRLMSAAYLQRVQSRLRDPLSLRAVGVCETTVEGGGDPKVIDALRDEIRTASHEQRGRHRSESAEAERRREELFAVQTALRFDGECSPLAEYGEEWDELVAQAALVRDIFGNPFRPVAFNPAWRSETVTALASAIYAERAFDRLPILADALEEVGCDDQAVLDHCRGEGPHARGCWVVDLVLGKGS